MIVDQYLILIGFKNVGKSAVGSRLAEKLDRPFIDLDDQIQLQYQKDMKENLSCRDIMKKHGEKYFRALEEKVLETTLEQDLTAIIAVGGGTPLSPKNRKLLSKHKVVHIVAPKKNVFERIMSYGKPAFFEEHEEAFSTFEKFWEEREPFYEQIADLTIQNTGSIEEAVEEIKRQLLERNLES